jgi:hypothetical protein
VTRDDMLIRSAVRRMLALMGGRKAVPKGSDLDKRIAVVARRTVEHSRVVGAWAVCRTMIKAIRDKQGTLQSWSQEYAVLEELLKVVQRIDL